MKFYLRALYRKGLCIGGGKRHQAVKLSRSMAHYSIRFFLNKLSAFGSAIRPTRRWSISIPMFSIRAGILISALLFRGAARAEDWLMYLNDPTHSSFNVFEWKIDRN